MLDGSQFPLTIRCPNDGAEICKNCRYYGSVTTTDTTWYCARTIAEVDPNASCEYWKTAKQTNADRIRAMTDEEFAMQIASFSDCYKCIAVKDDCCLNEDACAKAWLDWLKEECER